MNYTTAIFLINPKVRAVAATYEADDKTAPRTIFKTFDQTMSVGDFIVVPTNTRHNLTVCKVVEVDIDVDVESPTQMQWAVGVIDKAAYDDVLAQETRAIDMMRAAEKTHAREELRKKMLAHVDETKLAALQITRMTGDGIEGIPTEPAPEA